jgi:TetR/AcrR family transcriptional repressor of mexCD-oprJ operon
MGGAPDRAAQRDNGKIPTDRGKGERFRMSHAAQPAGGQPRRADARRNVAAILTAATDCLAGDPDTSMADIAAAAGVGRMTLYGHFKTRAELLDAVLARAVAVAHETLAAVDVSGDPAAALGRLVAASWLVVDQLRQVLAAAQRELPAERIRQAHDPVLGRVQELIERGQAAGAFRTDQPLPWLVNLAMTVMHAAASEVTAGRLASGQAPGVVAGTLLAALTAPGAVVPPPGTVG